MSIFALCVPFCYPFVGVSDRLMVCKSVGQIMSKDLKTVKVIPYQERANAILAKTILDKSASFTSTSLVVLQDGELLDWSKFSKDFVELLNNILSAPSESILKHSHNKTYSPHIKMIRKTPAELRNEKRAIDTSWLNADAATAQDGVIAFVQSSTSVFNPLAMSNDGPRNVSMPLCRNSTTRHSRQIAQRHTDGEASP